MWKGRTARQLLVALVTLACACGGKDANEPFRPAPTTLTKAGGDKQESGAGAAAPNPVVVRLTDQRGSPMAGQLVVFTVRSGGGTVTPAALATDADGRAQATWTLGSPGANTLEAVVAGVAPQLFTATAINKTRVTIAPDSALMPSETTRQFSVTVVDSSGATLASPMVSWRLDDAIGDVNASGLVTARLVGATKLWVKWRTDSASALVTIRPGALASLEVTAVEGGTNVAVGDSTRLRATGRDAAGNVVTLTAVDWSSSNTAVATVRGAALPDAWVKGIAPGDARITAAGTDAAGTSRSSFIDATVHGIAWTRMTSPTTSALRDVWGTSASDVFASGDGVILHFNGSAWSTMTLPAAAAGVSLTRIWGTSGSNVYATNDRDLLLHYDGSGWTTVQMPVAPFVVSVGGKRYVWVNSDRDAMAVINYDQATSNDSIMHWDGTAWTTQLRTVGGNLGGIWMSADGKAFAGARSNGGGYFYDGASWQPAGMLPRMLGPAKGTSTSNFWVYRNSLGGCCTWDHHSGLPSAVDFQVEQGSFSSVMTIDALWFVSANEVYASGKNGNVRLLTTNRSVGTDEGVPNGAIWGASPTDLFLVTPAGAIYRKHP